MPTATVHRPLAHEDRGAGTPVVLLHGLTFDRSIWAPIVQQLGDDVRTVVIDLPGHGETGGSACSLWDAAARVNDTVTGLGIDCPIVVGHSMAAAIGGIYAASYRTCGLVQIDQPFEIRPFARIVRSLWPALSGPNFAAAFQPFAQSIGVERLPEPQRSRVLSIQDIRQDLVLGYWNELARTPPEEIQARIDATSRGIACPYLAVFGRALHRDERNDLLDRIPHAEIEEWSDGGHCVHLVDVGRFTTRLRAFVESCAGGAR